MNKINRFLIFIFIVILLMPVRAEADRIKDITNILGVRKNYLYGYGLVIGLDGTGDSTTKVPFVTQSLVAMLSRMNITIPAAQISVLKIKNIAAVMVTAELPQFSKVGNKIDISVSSIGDAKSLKGGMLLFTPLKAADGKIYSIAQGSISVGGQSDDKKSSRLHLTVGRIAGGGTIEKEVQYNFKAKNHLTLSLKNPDFTTSYRIADAINKKMKSNIARPFDSGNIKIKIPVKYRGKQVEFIQSIESIYVTPDTVAKIVIDERTGTVVMGKDVMIAKAAISHGNLTVEISSKQGSIKQVAAPAARGRSRGRRGAAPKGNKLVLIQNTSNIEELVSALNAIGVSPGTLINIFKSLKASGAIQADLEII